MNSCALSHAEHTHRLHYLCSCGIEFFISACCEKQMAYFEVAVMCVERWIDGWDSLCLHISLSPPSNVPSLHTSPSFLPSFLGCVFTYICGDSCVRACLCVCLHPDPDKGPARVHWLGGGACSVVMRASLVWLGGSSTIS